jgi:hypothetical protein
MPSQDKRVKKLEEELRFLKNNLTQLARAVVGQASLIKLLIQRVGITDAETKDAFIKDALDSAEKLRVRSQGAGTPVRDSGNGDAGIPPAKSDRGDQDRPDQQAASGSSTASDQPAGDDAPPFGG